MTWKRVGRDRNGKLLFWHQPDQAKMIGWPGCLATKETAVALNARAVLANGGTPLVEVALPDE